jgi:flavodoxin
MRALVIYESMFGNTKRVATAVADGLRESLDVEMVEAGKAPASLLDGVDLVVVGGPTHAVSMSRQSTREDAVRQGAKADPHVYGIREWIDLLEAGPHSTKVATFDTRVGRVRHLPGSAAKAAAKGMRRQGYTLLEKPHSFFVQDTEGQLFDGELDRARAWGAQLAASLTPAATI